MVFTLEQKKIDRINALAKKSKTVGLTDEEKKEQTHRNEYRQSVVNNLTNQLDHCYIVDKEGHKKKVTPKD